MEAEKSYSQKEPTSIQKLFDNIAGRYDLGNSVLSFGLHKLWNAKLVEETCKKDSARTLLDLCAGTGDIAFAHLSTCPEKQKAILLDFSKGMLEQAREKAKKLPVKNHEIEYIHGDAMNIPLLDETVDLCTIAYGIRNVETPQTCFREVHRVLKKGGRFGILELTRPQNPLLRGLHKVYLKCLLPLMGGLLSANKDAYSYLSKSIYSFSSPDELCDGLKKSDFKNVEVRPLLGGIAHIITANKG